MRFDDGFDPSGAEDADQLVFEVLDAYEEAERFHPGAIEVGTEAGSFEPAPEVALLSRVTQARQPGVAPVGPEPFHEAPDVRRAAHGDDGDAFRVEIRPRRRASASSATLSLSPSTSTTVFTSLNREALAGRRAAGAGARARTRVRDAHRYARPRPAAVCTVTSTSNVDHRSRVTLPTVTPLPDTSDTSRPEGIDLRARSAVLGPGPIDDGETLSTIGARTKRVKTSVINRSCRLARDCRPAS